MRLSASYSSETRKAVQAQPERSFRYIRLELMTQDNDFRIQVFGQEAKLQLRQRPGSLLIRRQS